MSIYNIRFDRIPSNRIHYVSAPAGSGKTHQLIAHACKLAEQGSRVMVLQPTKELINKTVEDELLPRKPAFRHSVFHQGTIGEGASVTGAIVHHLNNAEPDAGQIVFATHQAFPRIPFFANKGDWHLLIDEEMQVNQYQSHRLPHTHFLITDDIELEPFNSIYSKVAFRNRASLEAKGRNEDEDEVYEELAATIYTLTNNNWESYVNTEQFKKLRGGNGQKKLEFHSLLKPAIVSGFASVTMVAANFTDTLLYHLWNPKLKFLKNEAITAQLRYSTHTNGDRITIHHGFDNPWSGKTAEKQVSKDKSVRDALVEATRKALGDKEFLWLSNKKHGNAVFFDANGTQLPHRPEGLNSFSHIDNIAFLAALNPAPAQFKFLESFGVDGETVRRAIYGKALYQAINRTSLRDPTCIANVAIIVPDHLGRDIIQEYFPGAKDSDTKLNTGVDEEERESVGRKRKHATDAGRVAAHRQNEKEKRLKMLRDLLILERRQDGLKQRSGINNLKAKKGWENECNEMGNIITENVTLESPILSTHAPVDNCPDDYLANLLTSDFKEASCCGTFYATNTSEQPMAYLEWIDEFMFVAVLESFHRQKIKSKEDNFRISPAVFDPTIPSGGFRRRDNIVYLRNVWLDFEDGDLSPKEFAALFPNLRMVICNSYRHTRAKPRYRVIIPTTAPVTPEVYEALYDSIVAKLRDSGYSVVKGKDKNRTPPKNKLRSGLDWSKHAPTSMFLLPRQAQDASQSFFDYHHEGRETLDPSTWIENASLAHFMPEFVDVDDVVAVVAELTEADTRSSKVSRQPKLPAAIQRFRFAEPGTGHDAFLDVAKAAFWDGMPFFLIKNTLESVAEHAPRSSRERKSNIRHMMRWLKEREKHLKEGPRTVLQRRRQQWGA
jgi:hypothetical protein